MQIGLDFNLVEDLVAGVDEVGRGPLCGAVVTAAVILDPARPIAGLNDSKKLTEARREKLYDEICEKALSWCIHCVTCIKGVILIIVKTNDYIYVSSSRVSRKAYMII